VPYERDWGIRIHPPVLVESGVVLGRDIELGPEVYLEAGCELGEGVNITRAVVLRQAYIPAGSRIAGEVVG
jgi:NDP-sugar pyrophosphorylase family protein